jgi:hypothetical protein
MLESPISNLPRVLSPRNGKIFLMLLWPPALSPFKHERDNREIITEPCMLHSIAWDNHSLEYSRKCSQILCYNSVL